MPSSIAPKGCLLVAAVIAALGLARMTPAAAGDDPCDAAKRTSLPAANSAGPAPTDCDSLAFYYGIGRKRDFKAARACALHAPAETNYVMEMAFNGPGLLAMIYANGDGVPRDDDLAIAYACKVEAAPAEMSGRLAHLLDRKAKGAAVTTRFDICDDITSGMMEGACTARDSRIEGEKRKATLAALTGKLDAPAKQAYTSLHKAADAYKSAIAENEVDQSGTARAAMAIAAEDDAEATFIETIKAVLSSKAMPATPGALAKADAALNTAYRKVMGQKDADMLGTVTKDGIKKTEKLWLGYRDRFLAFAKVAAPTVEPDALNTRLTEQRTANLKGLLGEE